MKGASNRFQMIMAPSILLVTLPGMPKSCHDCSLSFICRSFNREKQSPLHTTSIHYIVIAKQSGSMKGINSSIKTQCKSLTTATLNWIVLHCQNC
jgi:hypothetical protein